MQQTVLITGGSRGIGAAAVLAFAQAGYRVAFTWHSNQQARPQRAGLRPRRRPRRRVFAAAGRRRRPCADAHRRAAHPAGTGRAAGAGVQRRHRAAKAVYRHHRRGLAARAGRRPGRRVLRLQGGIARHDPAEIWAHPAGEQHVGPDRRQLRGRLQRRQSRADRPGQGAGQGGRPQRHHGQHRRARRHRHRHDGRFYGRRPRRPGRGNAGRRLGTPEEVARTLVFLADEASGYITGQVIGLNGGLVI